MTEPETAAKPHDGLRHPVEIDCSGTSGGLMLIGALCAGQIIGWTLAPVLAHDAMPPDLLEGYSWGREWVLATYKHPALPSWTLEASRLLTGTVGWPAYLVAQLFVATTFVFVFLLGRDLLGSDRGAAGTLLLTSLGEGSIQLAQTLDADLDRHP